MTQSFVQFYHSTLSALSGQDHLLFRDWDDRADSVDLLIDARLVVCLPSPRK